MSSVEPGSRTNNGVLWTMCPKSSAAAARLAGSVRTTPSMSGIGQLPWRAGAAETARPPTATDAAAARPPINRERRLASMWVLLEDGEAPASARSPYPRAAAIHRSTWPHPPRRFGRSGLDLPAVQRFWSRTASTQARTATVGEVAASPVLGAVGCEVSVLSGMTIFDRPLWSRRA